MKPLYQKLSVASIGLEMGLCVVIGYLAGSWVDERFELAPYGTITCLLLGCAAAFKGLLRTYRMAQKTLTESEGVEG